MKKTGLKKRPVWRRILLSLIALALLGGVAVGILNAVVLLSTENRIHENAEAAAESLGGSWDCILVLGAGVRADGTPSHMLEDRLKTAIALYQAGAAPKLLMSGDHGQIEYDEVNVMRQYALDAGVPSEDIFMDHAGFSTYDSIYRARDVFLADRILVVTQRYHLPRALYIAEALGVEAEGISADLRVYAGQIGRDVREAAARVKDWAYALLKPAPVYLGDEIPVSGNGEATLG